MNNTRHTAEGKGWARALAAFLLAGSMALMGTHNGWAGETSVSPAKPTLPTAPSIPAHTESVLDYGALANDGKDDTAAIQAAMDSVSAKGGGAVTFPEGRYDISIGTEQAGELVALVMRSGVHLSSEQPGGAVLRLADNQGNYDSIFIDPRPEPVHDFALTGLVIDQNGLNNKPRSKEDLYPSHGAMPRFAMVTRNAERVLIDGVRFTNHLGVNVLNLGTNPYKSTEGTSDFIIRNSTFDNVGWDGWDFDHSSIYSQSDRFLIENNVFRSRYGAGTHSVRAAIETHGADQTVRHNVVDGFVIGINVTGAKVDSPRQDISHNSFLNAARGIYLWSMSNTQLPEEAVLRDVRIAYNRITVNPDAWLASEVPSRANLGGVLTNKYSTGHMKGILIAHNSIEMVNFDKALGSYALKVNEAGVSLTGKPAARGLGMTDVVVEHNKIANFMGSGVYSDLNHRGVLVISKNHIDQPLRGGMKLPEANRGAIVIADSVAGARIDGNHVKVSKSAAIRAGVIANSQCVSQACLVSKTYVPKGVTEAVYGDGWTKN